MNDIEHELKIVNEDSLKIALKIHKGKIEFITNTDTTDNKQTDGTKTESD